MGSSEIDMGEPGEKTPEGKEGNQPSVEVAYAEPRYYTDGDGYLTITVANNPPTVLDLSSQYLTEETIGRIKARLETATNHGDREKIIDDVRAAIKRTKLGGRVDFKE